MLLLSFTLQFSCHHLKIARKRNPTKVVDNLVEHVSLETLKVRRLWHVKFL